MRVLLRVGFLLVVFVGVGLLTAHSVITHASAATPLAEVRLSAAMAGLFAGGAAVVVVGIVMLWRR
jgi:uncharacterized membrane protein